MLVFYIELRDVIMIIMYSTVQFHCYRYRHHSSCLFMNHSDFQYLIILLALQVLGPGLYHPSIM